jgi:hypothetical protein
MPSFAVLWHNHPNVKGDAPLLDKRVYANQCAINVSAALMRSGVDLGSFPGARAWQKDKPKYALRAQELANWFAAGGARLGVKTGRMDAKEAFGRVEGKKGMMGRTGMVFVQDYWGPGDQGDHIDLWNGSRMTDRMTWARIHIRVGDRGLHDLGFGSDFEKARSVWFWACP